MSKDSQLQNILEKISIDDDRRFYTKHYDVIRNFVIEALSKDLVFKNLFYGTDLSGSYADGVRINKPDEFDCYIFLNFAKFFDTMAVRKGFSPSTAYPQLVRPNISYSNFRNIIDNLLGYGFCPMPKKINSWIQGLIAKEISPNGKSIVLNGERYSLRFSTHGPAQTLEVSFRNYKFSIDFVPSIKVLSNQYFVSDRNAINFDGQNSYWNLVCKPDRYDEKAFKTSFTKMESFLIKDKQQFKNVLRLLKKLRDKNQLTSLKSYFIKTACLWVNEEKGERFWNNSLYDSLVFVLSRLIEFCKNGRLPCYWDKSENMLEKLDYYQRNHITSVLQKELQILETENSITRVFI